MAGVDLASLRFVGDGYRDTLRKLHAGEQAGVDAPDRAYIADASFGGTALAMISALDARNGEPMRLTTIAWDKISATIPAARDEIAGFRRELESYDTIVLVPRSPIVRRRLTSLPRGWHVRSRPAHSSPVILEPSRSRLAIDSNGDSK